MKQIKQLFRYLSYVLIAKNEHGIHSPFVFDLYTNIIKDNSYGKKYALGNLFLIDDTQDSDATNTHGKSKSVISNADFVKAKKYVKSGGKVNAIKSKYKLTEAQETELQSL